MPQSGTSDGGMVVELGHDDRGEGRVVELGHSDAGIRSSDRRVAARG